MERKLKLTLFLMVTCCTSVRSLEQKTKEKLLETAAAQLERLAPIRKMNQVAKNSSENLQDFFRYHANKTNQEVTRTNEKFDELRLPLQLLQMLTDTKLKGSESEIAKRGDTQESISNYLQEASYDPTMQERTKRSGSNSGSFVSGIATKDIDGIFNASSGASRGSSSSSDPQPHSYGPTAYLPPVYTMIQGITSLPHKWDSYYAGSGYAFSNPEPPSEIQVSRLDGNSPNPRPSIQEKRPALNRGKAPISDSRIVFPTDRIDHHIEKLPLSVVPICQGKTFCEETPYYPEDLLDNVIGKAEEFRFLSGVDVVSDVVQRIDVSDDTPLCVSNEQVVYPQSAENQNKEWLFVVNHRNFTQGVRIETCSNVDGECSIFEGFAEGYRTTCKQKYIYRQLAAIAPNGSIKSDMFRFPSSCCCHVKFLGSPLVRMRISLAKSNFTAALKKKLE